MSFHTRQSLAYVPPTAVFRTRNGRFVHQPVIAGGVRGLGDVSLVPTGIKNTAPGLPTIPTMKVENTRMRIAQEETLRLAPAGPGLPGSFVSSSALRTTTGRGSSTTAASGSSLTPGSGSLTSSLTRSRDFILRSGGDVAPAEQPTGAGIMPTLSAEEMDALRARAGLPPISSSDFMQGLTFGQIAGAAVGFAVGLGLLLLRRK